MRGPTTGHGLRARIARVRERGIPRNTRELQGITQALVASRAGVCTQGRVRPARVQGAAGSPLPRPPLSRGPRTPGVAVRRAPPRSWYLFSDAWVHFPSCLMNLEMCSFSYALIVCSHVISVRYWREPEDLESAAIRLGKNKILEKTLIFGNIFGFLW